MRTARAWLGAVGAAAVLTGCSVASADDVTAVVAAFTDPGSSEEARCDLLAPATRSTVESEAAAPCAEAIGEVALPAGAVSAVEVWGGNAQARVGADDVVFLTETSDGWRITAAACVPRGEALYDCEVEGP